MRYDSHGMEVTNSACVNYIDTSRKLMEGVSIDLILSFQCLSN